MRRITWKFWAFATALIGMYLILGLFFNGNGVVEANMYKYGLGVLSVVVLAFVSIYTFLGLTGSAKWWRNDVGANFVLLALGVLPISGPLAWVFWFDHGMLTNTWLAWIEVGGPAFSAILYAWRCQLWLRAAREDRQ